MNTDTNTQALPPGTRLEEFLVERVLGHGGFGITYLAYDTSLGRKVVLKENLPMHCACRAQSSLAVVPRHTQGDDAEEFDRVLRSFAIEAATLASLDHPGIVRILQSFRALGTAYFVMPYVEGVALDQMVKERWRNNERFGEEELRVLLEPLLDALGYLHDRGIYHRDIKPANILVTSGGLPVLIDFGAARQRLSERSMTVVESAGYTPFEQLESRGNVGPWSDLYALGATLAKALTDAAPPKANDRMRRDPWVPLADRPELRGAFSAEFLRGIDTALRTEESERWQVALEWQAALNGTASWRATVRTTAPAESSGVAVPAGPAPPPPQRGKGGIRSSVAVGAVLALLAGVGAWAMISSNPKSKAATALAWEKPTRSNAGESSRFEMIAVQGGRLTAASDLGALNVGDFRIGKTEVTWGQWKAGRDAAKGYDIGNVGKGNGDNHPVTDVSWYDALKWCNAASEAENLTPVYTVNGQVYRSGQSKPDWNRKANGYRLPSEEEWEFAFRGGTRSRGFLYSGSNNLDEVGWYDSGSDTKPVAGKSANELGLHDMSGNVWEWCWDASGSFRRIRGGGWNDFANYCSVSFRYSFNPDRRWRVLGFRLARSSGN